MTAAALHVFVEVVETFLAVCGLGVNLYIVTALILARQLKNPCNVLLLHFAVLQTLSSLIFLCISTPSLFAGQFVGNGALCAVQGFLWTLITPLAVWNLAAIHLDRFVQIAYPLRYSAILSFKKALFLLTFVWLINLTLASPTLFSSPSLSFYPGLGACCPSFPDNPFYPPCYLLTGFLLPLLLILAVNLKIVTIAKYHQFRIANALMGMAFPAQGGELSEGAKARQRQKDALKGFQGTRAIVTITEHVGSLYLFFVPFSVIGLYEGFSGLPAPELGVKMSAALMLFSPILNGFIFGLKNKTIQTSLVNFARKEMMKSELDQEIRLRSPGLNSTRPSISMCNIVGHITLQMPMLQRQLSYASLAPELMGGRSDLFRSKSTGGSVRRPSRPRFVSDSCSYDGDLDDETDENGSSGERRFGRPPAIFKRYKSDLSWRLGHGGGGGRQNDNNENGKAGGESGGIAMCVSAAIRQEGTRCMALATVKTNSGSEGELDDEKDAAVEGSGVIKQQEIAIVPLKRTFARVAPPTIAAINFTFQKFDLTGQSSADSSATPFSADAPTTTTTMTSTSGPVFNYDSSDSSSVNYSSSAAESRQASICSSSINNQQQQHQVSKKSLTPTKNKTIKQAIKTLWQGQRKDKPRITITRVPTVDQSSLEFLYPLPNELIVMNYHHHHHHHHHQQSDQTNTLTSDEEEDCDCSSAGSDIDAAAAGKIEVDVHHEEADNNNVEHINDVQGTICV